MYFVILFPRRTLGNLAKFGTLFVNYLDFILGGIYKPFSSFLVTVDQIFKKKKKRESFGGENPCEPLAHSLSLDAKKGLS